MDNEYEISLKQCVDEIKSRIGKELLTDDDILLMILSEIAHTFTYEEKNYSNKK